MDGILQRVSLLPGLKFAVPLNENEIVFFFLFTENKRGMLKMNTQFSLLLINFKT